MKRHMKQIGILLSVVLVIGLCGVCFTSEYEVTATESFTEISKGKLLCDTPSVTQNDLDKDFLDYATEKATIAFPSTLSDHTQSQGANVVGVVLDMVTEERIPNATISVNGQSLVVTGDDGRFQIYNTPNDTYDWKIEAMGYEDAQYLNYSVDSSSGATIFTFYIDQNQAILKDAETIHDGGGQTIPPINPDPMCSR